MEKIKYLIMIGGTLILIGIVLKIFQVAGPWATICFSVGGTLKLLYLIIGAKTGLVKIGNEIALLVIGLTFIFLAVYFKRSDDFAHLYGLFLVLGLSLKTLFVVLFVRRQKAYRKKLISDS